MLHVPSDPCVPRVGGPALAYLCLGVAVENVGVVYMGLKGPDLPSTVHMPCAYYVAGVVTA